MQIAVQEEQDNKSESEKEIKVDDLTVEVKYEEEDKEEISKQDEGIKNNHLKSADPQDPEEQQETEEISMLELQASTSILHDEIVSGELTQKLLSIQLI